MIGAVSAGGAGGNGALPKKTSELVADLEKAERELADLKAGTHPTHRIEPKRMGGLTDMQIAYVVRDLERVLRDPSSVGGNPRDGVIAIPIPPDIQGMRVQGARGAWAMAGSPMESARYYEHRQQLVVRVEL